MSIPAFGVGTFRLKDQVVIDSVRNALDLGYRAVDTAQIYGNEAQVGQALAESGVARDALFVTTKIWTDNYSQAKLIPSLQDSLKKLRTDYVDLTLIHWPAPLRPQREGQRATVSSAHLRQALCDFVRGLDL